MDGLDRTLFDDASARRTREAAPKSPALNPRDLQLSASTEADSLLREAAEVLTQGMVPKVAFWRPGRFGAVKVAEGWAIDPLYLASTGEAYRWGGGGRSTDATERRRAKAHRQFGPDCLQVGAEITVQSKEMFPGTELSFAADGHAQIQYNDHDRLWSPLADWLNTQLRWILQSK